MQLLPTLFGPDMNLTRAEDCDSEGETLAGVDKSRPSGRAAAPLGRGLITTMLLMSQVAI